MSADKNTPKQEEKKSKADEVEESVFINKTDGVKISDFEEKETDFEKRGADFDTLDPIDKKIDVIEQEVSPSAITIQKDMELANSDSTLYEDVTTSIDEEQFTEDEEEITIQNAQKMRNEFREEFEDEDIINDETVDFSGAKKRYNDSLDIIEEQKDFDEEEVTFTPDEQVLQAASMAKGLKESNAVNSKEFKAKVDQFCKKQGFSERQRLEVYNLIQNHDVDSDKQEIENVDELTENEQLFYAVQLDGTKQYQDEVSMEAKQSWLKSRAQKMKQKPVDERPDNLGQWLKDEKKRLEKYKRAVDSDQLPLAKEINGRLDVLNDIERDIKNNNEPDIASFDPSVQDRLRRDGEKIAQQKFKQRRSSNTGTQKDGEYEQANNDSEVKKQAQEQNRVPASSENQTNQAQPAKQKQQNNDNEQTKQNSEQSDGTQQNESIASGNIFTSEDKAVRDLVDSETESLAIDDILDPVDPLPADECLTPPDISKRLGEKPFRRVKANDEITYLDHDRKVIGSLKRIVEDAKEKEGDNKEDEQDRLEKLANSLLDNDVMFEVKTYTINDTKIEEKDEIESNNEKSDKESEKNDAENGSPFDLLRFDAGGSEEETSADKEDWLDTVADQVADEESSDVQHYRRWITDHLLDGLQHNVDRDSYILQEEYEKADIG